MACAAHQWGLEDAVVHTSGTALDEMVELLCTNLQKDDLAALNASMSAEGVSPEQQQKLVKVCCMTSFLSPLWKLAGPSTPHDPQNTHLLPSVPYCFHVCLAATCDMQGVLRRTK